jgi:hypothetical protein
MKKLLLSLGFVGAMVSTQAQVIFAIEAPAGIAGNLGFEYATTNGWGGPDMTDPLNAIIDTLMLVDDGTTGDSLNCFPAINNLTGKIAVLYRGDCQFGVKALNAESAGAIAVLIINNVSGSPIVPGGGTDGPNVTIPVAMVSDIDGAIIKASLDNGDDVVAFFGSKSGYFANDMGLFPQHALVAGSASVLAPLSVDGTEFDVQLGSWIFNYGSADQSGITVTADVVFGGSSIYNNVSGAINILSGDSAYVTFPNFTQSTYTNGEYTLSYAINVTGAEDYPSDNVFTSTFLMDQELFTVSQIDATTKEFTSTSGIQPSGVTSSFTPCVVFSDPNASRIGARGLSFTASAATGTSLAGELFEIRAYEWLDVFTDINDAGFNVTNINEVAFGEYVFPADDQGVTVYGEFEEAVALTDNQRYLFCVSTYNPGIFIGFENNVNYELNNDTYLQPLQMFESDGTWSSGFTSPVYPSIMVHTLPAGAVGIEENVVDVTPFPNPASSNITIPFTVDNGAADLTVFDVSGKLVMSQNIAAASNQLNVNVNELDNGLYVFNVTFENGKTATFNVVVAK